MKYRHIIIYTRTISINRRALVTAVVDNPYCRCGDKQYPLRKRSVAFITVIGIFSRNSICNPEYIAAQRLPSKVTWLRFRAYVLLSRRETCAQLTGRGKVATADWHTTRRTRRPSVDWRPTDIAVWRFSTTSHGVHRSRYRQLSYALAVFVSTKNVIFVSAKSSYIINKEFENPEPLVYLIDERSMDIG